MENQVGVELGYLNECETWQLQSRFFPSKVGGKPAWVNLEFVPGAEQLECRKCKNPSIFLLQLYAPYDEAPHIPKDRSVRNFHRSLFVFICKNPECCVRNNSDNIKVFRNSLPRSNKFYPYNPPEDILDPSFSLENWTKLCRLCGCFASKKCSKCRVAHYCSRQHQVADWKLHKTQCGIVFSERLSDLLFPEWEIITEAEEIIMQPNTEETCDLEQLKVNHVGTLENISDSELSKYAHSEEDKVFRKFQNQVASNPDQIISISTPKKVFLKVPTEEQRRKQWIVAVSREGISRQVIFVCEDRFDVKKIIFFLHTNNIYQRGGNPLWIAKKPLPTIPRCENCGGPRRFEFQVMPQLLAFLHETTLDWGVLVVYTCDASCDVDGKYKEEFVFKQDVEVSEHM
nr:unnamed protein product [Callosobruchus analis]